MAEAVRPRPKSKAKKKKKKKATVSEVLGAPPEVDQECLTEQPSDDKDLPSTSSLHQDDVTLNPSQAETVAVTENQSETLNKDTAFVSLASDEQTVETSSGKECDEELDHSPDEASVAREQSTEDNQVGETAVIDTGICGDKFESGVGKEQGDVGLDFGTEVQEGTENVGEQSGNGAVDSHESDGVDQLSQNVDDLLLSAEESDNVLDDWPSLSAVTPDHVEHTRTLDDPADTDVQPEENERVNAITDGNENLASEGIDQLSQNVDDVLLSAEESDNALEDWPSLSAVTPDHVEHMQTLDENDVKEYDQEDVDTEQAPVHENEQVVETEQAFVHEHDQNTEANQVLDGDVHAMPVEIGETSELTYPPDTGVAVTTYPPEPAAQPTAPMMELSPTNQKVVRPVLNESILENVATMKPFTTEQLHSLYYNEQLEGLERFVDSFVKLSAYESHAFYEILMNNYRARNKLRTAEMDLRAKQNDYERLQGLVWSTTTHTITAKGVCRDKVQVSEQHIYEKAVFHENVCADITRVLGNIRTDLHDDLSLHAYSAQLSRLQVESYIHNMIMSSPVLTNIPRNAPVAAFPPGLRNYGRDLENLHICICILFSFQRKPVKDEKFREDTRVWLDRLVGILLRVASFSDHMFIVSHIMRCPAGVGLWGAQWVQPPVLSMTYNQTTFGSPVLDHFLALLAMVLLPVKDREEYLHQLGVEMTPERTKSNPWTLLDSDGEEEDEDPAVTWKYLHENDVVALLDQFNLEAMFTHVLFVENENGEPDSLKYDISRTSEPSMLRLFAFSTTLVDLLGKGLNNFTQTRYRQLNKRLGNMIRKTVCFVSDHWENFKAANSLHLATMARLGTEYDAFFYRCIETILSAQRLGSWQFIADMPFSNVSIDMMWRLVWLLHFGRAEELVTSEKCQAALLDTGTLRDFEAVLSKMSISESVYLLTALAGMAQGRSADDNQLVKTIVEEIYQIAYVSPHTREFCSKTGRELLSCIATIHPFVISYLLHQVKETIDRVGMVSIYLFSELPMLLWQPSDIDLETIQSWLLDKDVSSAENQLARVVLSNLNWGFNQQQDALFLPLRIHKKIGLLLVDAERRHVSSKSYGVLAEGVKQVASVVKNTATEQQKFASWVWEIALRLRVHKFNQCPGFEGFTDEPNLKQDPILSKLLIAVQDNNPLACYIALMMTSVGHSHVEFCCEGLAYLHTLTSYGKYQAVIQVLGSVVYLFYNQPHYLLGNERFSTILQMLLSPDPAYSTYAISFLFNAEIPEQVPKFICMVQSQLRRCSTVECDPSTVLDFWINALLSLSKWYTDRNILCCVDNLLQAAFVTKGGEKVAGDTIYKAYETLMLGSFKGQNVLSSFVSWLASGSQSMPSFLDKVAPGEFPWFAYYVLLAETRWETERNLWPSLQEEMIKSPRGNLEQMLKKTCHHLKLENGPGVHRLCIYRWGVVAMEIENGHPVTPLLWQNFFFLFLQRPTIKGVVMKSSVGEKFFESTSNITLLKKMKKRLSDIIEHHHKEATTTTTTLDDSTDSNSDGATALPESVTSSATADFHTKLISLYQSFKLWLDEPRLHDGNLYLPGLPVQYAAERLQRIFQGDKNPWLEYVDEDKVEYQTARSVLEWTTKIFPVTYGNQSTLGAGSRNISAAKRIIMRLSKKNLQLPPPALLPLKPPVPEVPSQLLTDRDGLMYALKSDFEELVNYAKSFSHRVSKHIELDCNYGELMPDLYGNEETEVLLHIPCRRAYMPNHSCEAPAEVTLRYEEKRRREIVNRKLEENRSEYKLLLSQSFLPPPQSVCTAAVHVENTITSLITLVKSEGCDIRTIELATDVGRALFYHIVLLVSDVTNHYPPCRQFFSSCVDVLGQEFVANHSSECSRLLLTILSTPLMAGGLAVHFTPNSSPCEFIHLYEKVIPMITTSATDTAFMLFTKFDIQQWLANYQPVLSERRQFATVLVDIMCICGAEPEDRLLKILEIAKTHLSHLLSYNFSESCPDALILLLKGSSEGRLHPSAWDIYLSLLGCTSYKTCGDSYQQCLYVHDTCSLSLQQVLEALEFLANYFHQSRTSDAAQEPFGLYPRWSLYIKPVACVIGFMCGFLITRAPASYSMSDPHPESVLARLWKDIVGVHSPWITPIDRGAVTHAAWVESDSEAAAHFVTMFVEALLLLHRQFEGTLPIYSHNVPCLLFEYYSKAIACQGCPEYMLQLFHSKLSRLPWNQFRPNIEALDQMTKLCDQSHPNSPGKYSCLQFLASIIPSLPWGEMVQFYSQYEPPEMCLRFHACLLQLLVQIFQESAVLEVPQGEALSMLALEAEQFHWHCLDDISYKGVVEIFLLNCNPRCVLAERTATNAQALRLLRLAANFIPSAGGPEHPQTFEKQRCFVQSYIRLVSQCSRLSNVNIAAIQLVLSNLLTDCETVLGSANNGHPDSANCVAMMADITSLLNSCDPNELVISSILTTIIQWLESSPCSILLLPTISAASRALTSTTQIVQLTECCIETHFNLGHGFGSDDWSSVLTFLDIPYGGQDEYLGECLPRGCFMTLYAHILHQMSLCESLTDEKAQLVTLVEWTLKVKPSSSNEAKLIFWFKQICRLCLVQTQHACKVRPVMEMFLPALCLLGEDKSTTGILGTLGLGKKSQLSIRFRLFCKSLNVFLLAQLPNDNSVRYHSDSPGHLVKLPTGGAKPTQKTLQAMGQFLGLKTKKEYRSFHETIDFVSNFTHDPRHSLNEVPMLIIHMVSILFPEVKYLSVIRKL